MWFTVPGMQLRSRFLINWSYSAPSEWDPPSPSLRRDKLYGTHGTYGRSGQAPPQTANCKRLTVYRSAVLAPITWREADLMFELPRQMIGRIETENQGDFFYGHGRIQQEILRLLDPRLELILLGTEAGRLLKACRNRE